MKILSLQKFFFINLLTLVIPYIPRRVSSCIAGLLGFFSFIILRGRRRAIIEVLGVVKPEVSHFTTMKLACKNLINYANNFADFLRLYNMDAKELTNMTEVNGLEHFSAALRNNKGTILLSAHLGNWEVGSNFMAAYGFPVVGVAESAGPGEMFYKLFKRYREHFGITILSLEDPSVGFRLRRFLKKGYIVGLIGDRDIAGTGVEVEFFGKRAIFPQGPAFLSLVTKSPIIPGFFLRNRGRGKKLYSIYAEEPIDFKGGKELRGDIKNLTQVIAKRIEEMIRRYPDQWFSFPPPWKRK